MTTGECIVMDGTRCILYRAIAATTCLLNCSVFPGGRAQQADAGPAMNNTSFQGEDAEEDRCSSRLGPKLLINVICYLGSSLLRLVINRYRALPRLFKGRKLSDSLEPSTSLQLRHLLFNFIHSSLLSPRDPNFPRSCRERDAIREERLYK